MGLLSSTRDSIKSADEIMREALGDILEKTSAYIEIGGIRSKPMNVLYEGSRDVMSTLDSLVRSLAVPLNINCSINSCREVRSSLIPANSTSYYITISHIPMACLDGIAWAPYKLCIFSPGRGRYVNIETEGNESFWLTWHSDGVYPTITYNKNLDAAEISAECDVYRVQESMEEFIYGWLEKAYGILERPRKRE